MSRIESGFVPLPKVEQEQPSDFASIRLNLPGFVDQDRIGINVSMIDKICILSGIEGALILGTKGDDTSREVPVVVGVNKDGSAIAGKAVEKVTIPTSDYGQFVVPVHKDMSLRTTGVMVKVNVDEISQRASGSKEGARSTAIWTEELDSAVKVPLRKAGTENLIRNWNGWYKFFYSFTFPFFAMVEIISQHPNLENYIFVVAQCLLLNRGVDYLQGSGDPHFRHSLFPGPQFDRAALLQIKARTQKVVADLHSDKK